MQELIKTNAMSNALKKEMANVVISAHVTDQKLVESLKRSAVYNAAGGRASVMLWKELATAYENQAWKVVPNGKDSKGYTSFPTFALDYVPGLAYDGRGSVSEGTIRAYLSAGRVINTIPAIESKGFSSDILNTLHSMLELDQNRERLEKAVESGELDGMSGKEVRQWVKDNKVLKGNAKLPKPKRLFIVPKYDEKGFHVGTSLMEKQDLIDALKATEDGQHDYALFEVLDHLVHQAFRLAEDGQTVAAEPAKMFRRETQDEANERVRAEAAERDAQVAQETFMQHMADEMAQQQAALLPVFGDAAKAKEGALALVKAKYPHSYDNFIAWLDGAELVPADTATENAQ